MWKPFSKRGKPQPDSLTYEIPNHVRLRIVHALADLVNRTGGSTQGMFEDAAREALKAYGQLHSRITRPDDLHFAGMEHFQQCDDAKAIDFLEWAFRSQRYYTAQQDGVDAVNAVFRDEGIGYEFSNYVMTTRKETVTNQWGMEAYRVDVQYPEATIKSNEVMHSTVVMPALALLSGKVWAGANDEMLKAHEHLRAGNYPDAIHWAGKCLESVLQIICDKKKWSFTPDNDTLNPLIQACYKNGLFPAPYIDVLQKSSGEIRNKWGGHGKARSAHGPATFEMAEHMIQVTSAHVVLLAKRAKM